MPLLATAADGTAFRSWDMGDQVWRALRSGYRGLGLAAPCCGGAVVPARSPNGLRFFRHRPGAACHAPESSAHLACKAEVARAAAALGLAVEMEARDPGGGWVADVLVRHPRWAAAVEVQLSRVPPDALAARQARYRDAGIRGAWLLGYGPALPPARRDLPVFRLDAAGGDGPAVLGGGGPGARTPLGRFARLLLTGGVRLAGGDAGPSPARVATVPLPCWRCGQPIDLPVAFLGLPTHATFAPAGVLPAADLAKVPGALAAYRAALPALAAACPSMATVRPPPPGREGGGARAHCPRCDAPTGYGRRAPPSPRGGETWTFGGAPAGPPAGPARWVWAAGP